jgi:hypothetical protein
MLSKSIRFLLASSTIFIDYLPITDRDLGSGTDPPYSSAPMIFRFL